ncbi:hypothetical protein J5N97_006192 [Dioscorea zingiberensis]|uniref:Homeobox domain-containing protein n=1 Tax=Dioscorea zingiberensis TaxID=325984 RepID=A0A9D5D9U9_9LILI|nr:hypothetical protein J5N97_006192 [Dioscorea zingiberensis]
MSSEVGGYEGEARLREHQLLLLNQHQHQHQHQHHQQQHVYHVPQHSRREKLRFQSYDPPQASSSSSSAAIQDPSPSLLFPNIPGVSSACSYFSLNPNTSPSTSYTLAPIPRFISDPLHQPQPNPHQSIPATLSSSSSAHPRPPPCPVLDHGPSRPFTGYAAVLSGSRFLVPARQLLEETCDAGHAAAAHHAGDGGSGSLHSDWLAMQDANECGKIFEGSAMGKEQQWKRTKLVFLLDEVYRRYTHYYQQAHAIIQAFESVAGLSTAAPYVSMALQALSKQFKGLANLISGQLRDLTNRAFGKEAINKEMVPNFGMTNCGVCGPRTTSNPGAFKQQPVWRPQRGLPERAVAVLRKWLFEHFLHPYPTDIDKQMLAKQTGLSRNQVSNWFINARVRLWKPMVEEIHSLEMRQSTKVPCLDKDLGISEQTQLPPNFTATNSDNQPTENSRQWKNQFIPLKQFRNEICHIPNQNEHPFDFGSNDLSSHHDVGAGVGSSGGNGGVTLTLGLRQSNGVCLAEPLHLNAVQGFGLEFNDAYCIGTMETQDRHYGRSMDGHLVRGFDG